MSLCFSQPHYQAVRSRWSSTPSSQSWTGTPCWGKKPSSSLTWSRRKTPATLTVSVFGIVGCNRHWARRLCKAMSLTQLRVRNAHFLLSRQLIYLISPLPPASALRSLSPHQYVRRGRHQWRRACRDQTVLFLFPSLQQGLTALPLSFHLPSPCHSAHCFLLIFPPRFHLFCFFSLRDLGLCLTG